MKYITVKLTQDQAFQIARILDYGKVDHTAPDYTPEDKRFNAFLQRIQDKLYKALAQAKN